MSEQKGMGIGEMVYQDLSRLDKVSRGEAISSSALKMPTAQKNRKYTGRIRNEPVI